ncbi:MAG: glycoside hydrolase family 108 protein [Bacteroidales bacterium]
METPRFRKFMPIILEHEGGFVNHKLDPGGATKYGISLRFLKTVGDQNNDGWLDGDLDHDGDVDIDDIRMLTPETVRPFYQNNFYDPIKIDQFTHENLALQIFDFAVNAGTVRAVKTLQKVIKIKDDGIVGPLTIRTANVYESNMMFVMYKYERIDFYRILAKKNPANQAFLEGWIRRANNCEFKASL